MDISKLMQQAQQMQNRMDKQKKLFENSEFSHTIQNGAIKIKMNGKRMILDLQIQSTLIKDDADMVSDLIKIAINECIEQVNNAEEVMLEQFKQLPI